MQTTVKDLRTLKALAKAGHIRLHDDTGKKVYWNGRYFKAWYIDDHVSTVFHHKGRKFIVDYRSGSFYPYVSEVIA